jgi:hypothetical protein
MLLKEKKITNYKCYLHKKAREENYNNVNESGKPRN